MSRTDMVWFLNLPLFPTKHVSAYKVKNISGLMLPTWVLVYKKTIKSAPIFP